MSIRKKIKIGFLILALLLLFSGLVSLFELTRLSERTKTILEQSNHNIELSKRMLDAAETQNSSLLGMIVLGQQEYDSSFLSARRDFIAALDETAATDEVPADLDSIILAWESYQGLVTDFFDEQHNTDVAWFLGIYQTTYNHLTTAIKEHMTDSQTAFIAKATQLESNAYRAITPGVLTLSAAIMIVLMFMFLIDFYYARPITKITKGLNDYLKLNMPFNVKTEGRSEISRLKEDIEGLIAASKNKKPE